MCYKRGWCWFITTFYERCRCMNHRQSWCHALRREKKNHTCDILENFDFQKRVIKNPAVNMWFFYVPPEENIFVLFLQDKQILQPWAKQYITSSISTSHQSLLFTEISSLRFKRSCAVKVPSMMLKEGQSENRQNLSCGEVHCKCVHSSSWKCLYSSSFFLGQTQSSIKPDQLKSFKMWIKEAVCWFLVSSKAICLQFR